jgi:4-amino-4-deoxy-L-arabinose transferase-like glycosyltransferase
MENDGLIYASIAKHLAADQGSFWFPYSPFAEPAFHHHPPLAFWLQAQFFKLFGDHFWTENLYQLVGLMLVLLSLHLASHLSLGEAYSWRVWLLYLAAPVVAFVFTDNFLEASLSVFVTLSVVLQLLAFKRKSHTALVMAAIFTLAAFLVKGPVGLLPLGTILVIGWMCDVKVKSLIQYSLIYWAVLVLIGSLVLISSEARTSLGNYIQFQWLGTAMGERPMVHGREYLLLELARNLLGMIVIWGLFAWRVRWRWHRVGLGWLIIALMATLPLLISPRQFKWYLAPAMPFYALALAACLGPLIRLTTKQCLLVGFALLGACLGVVYFSVTQFGTADNDFSAIHDTRQLQEIVPEAEIIGLCDQQSVPARYLLYLSRYHSIKTEPAHKQAYLLCETTPPNYQRLDVELDVLPLQISNDAMMQ